MMGDRQDFLKALADKLGQEYTADSVREILRVAEDVAAGYDIRKTESGEDATGVDYLRAFLDAKRVQGRTEKTLARYEYMLTRMLADVGAPVRSITAYHLRAYLMRCKDSGNKDSTLEGARCIYNSFFGWLHREGLIAVNPCANIGAVRLPKITRLPFSDTEIEQLKEACTCDRDRALLSFMLSTGCRIGEVVSLDRDSVDFQRLECRVYGKGRKERVVYLDTVTAMILRRYLRGRSDTSTALFVGRSGKRLGIDGLRAVLVRLGAIAGVTGVHPHRFRRTTATRLINRGMPVQDVAHVLGHENINTTMRYVHISDASVRYEYQRCAG